MPLNARGKIAPRDSEQVPLTFVGDAENAAITATGVFVVCRGYVDTSGIYYGAAAFQAINTKQPCSWVKIIDPLPGMQ